MSVKYYAHFVLRSPRSANEYLGVIEVSCALSRGDEAVALLARNLECESEDIQILQWSRVH